jgi:hypothetical protein
MRLAQQLDKDKEIESNHWLEKETLEIELKNRIRNATNTIGLVRIENKVEHPYNNNKQVFGDMLSFTWYYEDT